jgi:hypothetical protein
VGNGSLVTTTTCGNLPFLFRIRFSASVRAFCARSLRSVHLDKILACSKGNPPLDFLKLERLATLPST